MSNLRILSDKELLIEAEAHALYGHFPLFTELVARLHRATHPQRDAQGHYRATGAHPTGERTEGVLCDARR